MSAHGDGIVYAANYAIRPCQIKGCKCGGVMVGLLDENGSVIAVANFQPAEQAAFLKGFQEQAAIAERQYHTLN